MNLDNTFLKNCQKARIKVDQNLGNTTQEGDKFQINEIRIVYDEEIDHESNKICVYLPLSNENLIDLQGKDAHILKIGKQLISEITP